MVTSLLEVGGALQQEFVFQDAIDPFGQGVLMAVIAVCR